MHPLVPYGDKQAMEEEASQMTALAISFAGDRDIPEIKSIADTHRRELGFVLKAAFVDSAHRKAILVARNQANGELVGFVHFRHRRDKCTKVYQICVRAPYRRAGVGKALLGALGQDSIEVGSVVLKLHCPEDLSANSFYAALGFAEEPTLDGRRRKLRTWSQSLGILKAPQAARKEARDGDGR
jgi:GNAT superfamily N-acetyltransferase